MKTKVKNKKIDCVKMKNEIQGRIYRKIKEMSVDEMLTFFNSPENRVVFGK